VEYFVGKGAWTLQSEGHLESVEVGFSGYNGRHTFYSDSSLDTFFEIQRFWVRNLRPSSDAMEFFDPTVVLTPQLDNEEPCIRCGQPFRAEENSPTSCNFHAHPDGTMGEFKLLDAIIDSPKSRRRLKRQSSSESEFSLQKVPMWTCCGSPNQNSPGCASRPHTSNEMMLTVRADLLPTAIIGNSEVAVIHLMEIGLFPGFPHTLIIQVTRTLADLINKYFLISVQEGEFDDEGKNLSTPLVSDVTPTSFSTKDKNVMLLGGSTPYLSTPITSPLPPLPNSTNTAETPKTPSRKSLFGKMFGSGRRKGKGETDGDEEAVSKSNHRRNPSEDDDISYSQPSSSNLYQHNQNNQQQQLTSVVSERMECIYVNYIRVGVISVQVSSSGFPVNIDKFDHDFIII